VAPTFASCSSFLPVFLPLLCGFLTIPACFGLSSLVWWPASTDDVARFRAARVIVEAVDGGGDPLHRRPLRVVEVEERVRAFRGGVNGVQWGGGGQWKDH